LTKYRRQILRVEMEDWEGSESYAECDHFNVSSEETMYKLSSIGTCTGPAGQYDVKTDLIV